MSMPTFIGQLERKDREYIPNTPMVLYAKGPVVARTIAEEIKDTEYTPRDIMYPDGTIDECIIEDATNHPDKIYLLFIHQMESVSPDIFNKMLDTILSRTSNGEHIPDNIEIVLYVESEVQFLLQFLNNKVHPKEETFDKFMIAFRYEYPQTPHA